MKTTKGAPVDWFGQETWKHVKLDLHDPGELQQSHNGG